MEFVFSRLPDEALPADLQKLRHTAVEDLQFIRQTMERAASFTAVPGAGGVAIGLTALAAGWAARGHSLREQFWVWLWEGCVALVLGMIALAQKSKRIGFPLSSRAARRALLSFATPLFAGAMLTIMLYRGAGVSFFAGVWLLLYGVAVIAAGTFSVRIVPVMGICFLALGSVAVLSSPGLGNLWMTLGFGGLHIVFGLAIARNHGG